MLISPTVHSSLYSFRAWAFMLSELLYIKSLERAISLYDPELSLYKAVSALALLILGIVGTVGFSVALKRGD